MPLNLSKLNLTLMFTILLSACGGSAEEDGGGGGGGSHNAGLNCLGSGCHDGTSAATQYTAAGTAYVSGNTPQTNATVRFYVFGTNTLLATAQTDASGNFYTTNSFVATSLSSIGVEVEFTGPSGGMDRMNPAVNGGCNQSGCHDSGNRITARN